MVNANKGIMTTVTQIGTNIRVSFLGNYDLYDRQ